MEKVNEILSLLENGQQAKALSYYEEILNQGSNEERFVLGEDKLMMLSTLGSCNK